MGTPLVIDMEFFQSVTCHTVETHVGHAADMRSNVLGQVIFERSTERTLRAHQHFLFMVRAVVCIQILEGGESIWTELATEVFGWERTSTVSWLVYLATSSSLLVHVRAVLHPHHL